MCLLRPTATALPCARSSTAKERADAVRSRAQPRVSLAPRTACSTAPALPRGRSVRSATEGERRGDDRSLRAGAPRERRSLQEGQASDLHLAIFARDGDLRARVGGSSPGSSVTVGAVEGR